MLAEFGGESREESDGKARGLMDELKSKGRTASMSGQTFLLGVFLRKKAPHFDLPRLKRKAVAHGHCHHKALMKMNDDEAVFEKMGLDYEVLDSGCCGMAGAFGFERGDHYDVSMKCGERVLLPSVRGAPKDALIIADGF